MASTFRLRCEASERRKCYSNSGWICVAHPKLGSHPHGTGKRSHYVVSTTTYYTYRLQPLDVSVFKPLQTYYSQETEKWQRCHSGRGIDTFQGSGLLGATYIRGATMSNGVNGFWKCGIWPCDRYVFDVDSRRTSPPHRLSLLFRLISPLPQLVLIQIN